MKTAESLNHLMEKRIVVLDGAMGTMIQTYHLEESDFRGERFQDHPNALKNNNEALNLVNPELIEEIHLAYLRAGADIIETNTFNGTRISLEDFGFEDYAYEINYTAAQIAKRAVERFGQPQRWVGGSLGPTSRMLSMSRDVSNPGARDVTFDEMMEAYYEQAKGLLAGGVDLLICETTFDTLNLKAALFAIMKLFDEGAREVPLIASLTITDASGRTLSGQTLEAAMISIAHAPLFAVGLNCALGAKELTPHVEELSRLSALPTVVYPNAGLPNAFGAYDQTPEEFVQEIEVFLKNGWVNMVGGCCGTTAEHTRLLTEAVKGYAPRALDTAVMAAV